MSRFVTVILLLSTSLGGCTQRPGVSADALLGRQLQTQDAELVGQKFRTLLDFEHPADRAFVSGLNLTHSNGHTGQSAAGVRNGGTVSVSSLLFGSTLPGEWTLLGGYVAVNQGPITTSLWADGQEVARTTRPAAGNEYMFAAVDLTTARCRERLPRAKQIELRFDLPGRPSAGFSLDDVLLVDNRRTLVDTSAEPKLGWTVSISGLSLGITAATFRTTLPLVSGDAGGWATDEANAVRVRLHNTAGETWTILPDGRSIRNGRLTSLDGSRKSSQAADVVVDESTGRLDRETAGDPDNDGYNERRVAYQIVATGPRLKLRLSPRGGSADPPVLEVRGLPREKTAVTVDGRLIDQTACLPDGTLLVLVPMTLTESVEVTVGVSGE